MHIKIYNKHTHTHTIAYNWISFSFFVVRFCCYFWRQYCYDSILIDDTHSVCSSQHDSKFEIVRKFVCLMLDLMALVYLRSVRFGSAWFGLVWFLFANTRCAKWERDEQNERDDGARQPELMVLKYCGGGCCCCSMGAKLYAHTDKLMLTLSQC